MRKWKKKAAIKMVIFVIAFVIGLGIYARYENLIPVTIVLIIFMGGSCIEEAKYWKEIRRDTAIISDCLRRERKQIDFKVGPQATTSIDDSRSDGSSSKVVNYEAPESARNSECSGKAGDGGSSST